MSAHDESPPVPAAERLALSRERMRQSMRATLPPDRVAGAEGEPPGWLKSLADVPVLGAVIEAVRGWWSHHPLRLATLLAKDAGENIIRPVAQRHPLALVVGAMLLGGLVVWGRPWRKLIKPALFAGLLPQIVSTVVAHVPLESWMSALSQLTAPPPAAPQETEHAAEPAAPLPQAATEAHAAAPAGTTVPNSEPLTRPPTLH